MIVTGLILNGFASSRLIAFCAMSESGNLDYCHLILSKTYNANLFSWNLAMRGYSESKNPEKAIFLYKELLQCGELRPDNYTYPLLLKTCGQLNAISLGYSILGHVLCLGLDSDAYIHNATIHMLVFCGELVFARKVFDSCLVRDLVSWNSIINGYVRCGKFKEGLKLFREMRMKEVRPDEVTLISMVSCCSQMEDLILGRVFHQYIEENGLKLTVPLCNSLMDMYVKCGCLESAKILFNKMSKRSIVSWTTMVMGYAKFGLLDSARRVFDEMPEKDVVPWNALIAGYVQSKQGKAALALFYEMQDLNVKPDEVTMVSLLSACTQLGALEVGKWVHHYIEKHKFSINVALGTALVDMYAKCGNITKARQVFREISGRNSLTWTALIGGLALHGHAHEAISHYYEMIDIGLVPDEITYLGVLSACCHAGLVYEGRRAGFLDEAEKLIKSMPTEPDAVVWGALLFACKSYGSVAIGERVAKKLLLLDPSDSATYVLLANLYREAEMWDKAKEVRKMMRDRGVEKTPGCSSIEVNGEWNEWEDDRTEASLCCYGSAQRRKEGKAADNLPVPCILRALCAMTSLQIGMPGFHPGGSRFAPQQLFPGQGTPGLVPFKPDGYVFQLQLMPGIWPGVGPNIMMPNIMMLYY
ncbi:hypothetical protein C5167_049476 [Papaver somniferum]|uniref:Pentatricopeptide repeat-containing protein n=1 Tax=Papaver somniferum TaxID=3469 RepID=A0A4Y7KKY3_PAPSO|nr:hypothetical protein C5167_049476 [Papaver somniferum]